MSTRQDRIGKTGAVASGQPCPVCGVWVDHAALFTAGAVHYCGPSVTYQAGNLTDADIERIAQRVAQLLKGDPETALD